MRKLGLIFNKNNILTVLIIFITLAMLAFSSYFKVIPFTKTLDDEGYANKDIYAPFDFYDVTGTTDLAEKAAAETETVLVSRYDATFSSFEDISLFFDKTDTYRSEILKYKIQGSDFAKYLDNRISAYISLCLTNGIVIKYDQVRFLLDEISEAEYNNFKSIVTAEFSSVQNRDVFEANRSEMLDEYKDKTEYAIINSGLRSFSNNIADAFLRINSIVNTEETKMARDAARADVFENNPIIIDEETLIISQGEKADADTIRLLSEMNLMGGTSFNIKVFMGLAGLLAMLLVPVIMFKKLFSGRTSYTKRHILIICVIEIMLFALVYLVPGTFYLFMPVFILPMLVSILVDEKIAIIVGAVTAVFISFIYKTDITYLAILISTGTMSAYFARKLSSRMRLLSSGLILGLSASLIMFLLTLAHNSNPMDIIMDYLALIAGALISVILVIGLMPLFESVFNIITPFKLLELSNPNQPLLKKLLLEAPGTYHHSLMVGNLAEEAANEIGANGLLARVGAYYHDVGKMSRPGYFAENQGKDNPHNKMKPELSKLVIINHTKEGDEIAKKYKLPHAIRDFINEHHGTTQVKYFYNKAVEQYGNTVNPDEFRYEGQRPKTKESAVVMLADSVEAIVRAGGDLSRGEVEGIIRKAIKGKLDDGQFDLCDLTLKDFDDISNAFLRVFGGYFHKRIDYPEPKEGVKNGPVNEDISG